MRVSVSSIKKNYEVQQKPRQGSMLRLWYDEFKNNPAKPISFVNSGSDSVRLEQLRDYGLDIRHHSKGKYWLVGEYDYKDRYIDYLAELIIA